MSDLISKSALLDSLISCKELGRKSFEAVIKTIEEQSVTDEKEIICKFMERIVERLETELKLAEEEKERCIRENPLQFDSAKGYVNAISVAIDMIKEEGGIDA